MSNPKTEQTQGPASLMEAIEYFADPDVSFRFMCSILWPTGEVTCPRCGSANVGFIKTRRMFQCKGCKPQKQFSVKVGTIFEDSPIPLNKWLTAIWLIANCKNGISSHELARDLKTTQKTGWYVEHRIRLALQAGTFSKLDGEVEVDETFIGGKARNMHKHIRARKIHGTGGAGKVAVMGLLERRGDVRAKIVGDRSRKTMHSEVRAHVEPGTNLFTDAHKGYLGLSDDYLHQVIDHAEAYVKDEIHTNGLENFWSLLKRGLTGTYISVEPFHLFRYLDEQVWRYNHRKLNDRDRFFLAVAQVVGKRLTWKELTGKA
jgi:transposase-like protein